MIVENWNANSKASQEDENNGIKNNRAALPIYLEKYPLD